MNLTLSFKDRTGLVIRAYDDGFAYRFVTRFTDDTVVVNNETGILTFSPGDSLFLPIINLPG